MFNLPPVTFSGFNTLLKKSELAIFQFAKYAIYVVQNRLLIPIIYSYLALINWLIALCLHTHKLYKLSIADVILRLLQKCGLQKLCSTLNLTYGKPSSRGGGGRGTRIFLCNYVIALSCSIYQLKLKISNLQYCTVHSFKSILHKVCNTAHYLKIG